MTEHEAKRRRKLEERKEAERAETAARHKKLVALQVAFIVCLIAAYVLLIAAVFMEDRRTYLFPGFFTLISVGMWAVYIIECIRQKNDDDVFFKPLRRLWAGRPLQKGFTLAFCIGATLMAVFYLIQLATAVI